MSNELLERTTPTGIGRDGLNLYKPKQYNRVFSRIFERRSETK